LMINPVPDAQLHRLKVTVTGSVGDTNYAVWVNGVPAVVDSSGNWSATDVPVTKGCTASFTATAYPPDEVPPPEAAGQGTNPTTPNSCSSTLDQDKPPQVYIQQYELNYYSWATNYFIRKGGYPETEHLRMLWEQEAPAIWRYDSRAIYFTRDVFTDCTSLSSWPAATWEPVLDGTNVTTGAETNTSTVGPPTVPLEQCDIAGSGQYYNLSDHAIQPAYYSRVAQTVVKYFTGGKDAPDSLNLHQLKATLNSRTFQWWFGLGSTIEGSSIVDGATAGVFGTLGPDGVAYAALPDGHRVVATPRKAGVPYQGGDMPTVTKYMLRIFMGDQDVTDTNTPVVVGQQISLTNKLVGPSGKTPPPITNYQWTIPSYAVSNFYVAPDVSTGMVIVPFPTTNANASFYWVDGGGKEVRCDVKVAGTNFTAKAIFQVARPTVDWVGSITGSVAVYTNNGMVWLSFACVTNGVVTHGITFTASNPNLQGYGGACDFEAVQVLTADAIQYTLTNGATTNLSQTGLDNRYPTWHLGDGDEVAVGDAPGTGLNGVVAASYATSFRTLLMFQPTYDFSIPVPVREIIWNWSGQAVTNGAGGWTTVQSNCFARLTVTNRDTLEFPYWTNLVRNTDE
jgi:hypothetical protein